MQSLKPKFWDHEDVASGPSKDLFNFRRIWKMTVLLTAGVAIVPLILVATIDYNVTQQAIESEILLRTSRLVSNTKRAISFFLKERMSALDFINQDNSFDELSNPARLKEILKNLKQGFGGFVDLGVIDASGRQQTYVGPYKLEGKDYRDQEWFKKVLRRSIFISDVFMGFRKVPHVVIAVKQELSNGSFYVLRATIDTERFNELLSKLELAGLGDTFIINHDGILQTPSRYHGRVFGKIFLPVPNYAERTQVFEEKDLNGKALIVGYAYLTQTPFILMIIKHKGELMKPWYRTRLVLILFLTISIFIILVVTLGVVTYLVESIYVADRQRVMTLHEVEYSNKMASIGRLAASVAHEINNPLAIINEKAGLIKDLFILREGYVKDKKLVDLVDSVIYSVERCAAITRRLLSFTRGMELNIQLLNLEEVINEVFGFLSKEAEYRSIAVSVDAPADIPQLENDRGSLQEIFLNLFNNAFAAMSDEGHLEITVRQQDLNHVSVTVADDGSGIPQSDVKRVFEPYFSTKTKQGGTGLGLFITYGLVKKIGGTISVHSEVGKGTSFFITLPLHIKNEESNG